jgi:hypothetical protein
VKFFIASVTTLATRGEGTERRGPAHVHHGPAGLSSDHNTACLFAVMNGPNRPGGYAELLAYSQALNVNRRMTVRVNEFLGGQGFQPDAAAIVCEHVPGTMECRLKYKRYDDFQWEDGGTPRAGYYYNGGYTKVCTTNPALGKGWHLVDNTNSTIATTNW